MWVEHATVVSVEVVSGPRSRALLRDDRGALHAAEVFGGPNERGGVTRMSGFVVPLVGMRVRLDLREEPQPPRWDRAWTASGPVWTALPVSLFLGAQGSRDLGATEVAGEIEVAARAWSTIACTSFRAGYGGTNAGGASLDGKSTIYFERVWPAMFAPKGLAQTIVHTDGSNHIVDIDIHLNEQDYAWSFGGAFDLRSILTHELGHGLGLEHSSVKAATMFATYAPNLAWRSLEDDDRAAACALYPGKGAPGCDANPCPSGFSCVANACERDGSKRGVVCAPCDPEVAGTCAGAGDDARCVDVGGGLACGRACAADAECGAGFRCVPTTSSGDLQCVSQRGCANGASRCASDGDCALGACKNGACVKPLPMGAGADAGPSPQLPGGGCQSAPEPRGGNAWALVFLAFARGRRRIPAPKRSSPPRAPSSSS